MRRDHADYGKRVLERACGGLFQYYGPLLTIPGTGERVDGLIGNDVAVEVEARNTTQVRSAVPKLLRHPYPRKLLVIMIPNLDYSLERARALAYECSFALQAQVGQDNGRAIVLAGFGDCEDFEADAERVRTGISDWIPPPSVAAVQSATAEG
jgi:hypothetical protein